MLVLDPSIGVDWQKCGWFSLERGEGDKVERIRFINGEVVAAPNAMSYFNDFVIERNWWPTVSAARSPSSGCSVNLIELFEESKAASLFWIIYLRCGAPI
eukprot:10675879-Lingulodinium_polyedra.AAC.1